MRLRNLPTQSSRTTGMMLRTAPTEPRIAAGYGTTTRRALTIAIVAIAGVGSLLVWGLSVLAG